MEIKIKKIESKVIVSFADQSLEISKESEDWNNKSINNFLVKLASKTPLNTSIKVICQPGEDKVLNHIKLLFEEFAQEYNKSIKISTILPR